ncbi:MAG: hypothetical protein VYE15_07875, partial [Myxococcota bacterium]|nr:hypothetical protein [Myxococcota bacterium]
GDDTLPTGPPIVEDPPQSMAPSPVGPEPTPTDSGDGTGEGATPPPPPSPPTPVVVPDGTFHPALVASRLLAWLTLALAVRHLFSVLGGGWRFWHAIQAALLVWGAALLVFRHPTLMNAFYRLPNAETVLQRFGPKLRIAVAAMILVALGQVIAGTFDMIIHGFRALMAALTVGAVMVAPGILEYRWRDTWGQAYPPEMDHWTEIPGPVGTLSTRILEHEDALDAIRAASPAVVKTAALAFLCGALLVWGNGPFGHQWLGTSRSPEMDLLMCEDYNVRMGADAWEARNVPAKEWSYAVSEPPDCWVECVHRQWTEQKKRAAGVETLTDLALLVGPKCCKQCKGEYERGTTSRNSYCCL